MEPFLVIVKIIKVIAIAIPLFISIGGIHYFFYSRSPKYYFKVSKWTSKWKDTNWTITAGYSVSKNTDFYKLLEAVLFELYGRGKVQRTFNLKNKKLYEFGDFAVTVQYDADVSQDEFVNVDIIFNNMNVTVNTARLKLKELRLLFHEIERAIPTQNKWYNMNIKFNSLKNPFFGLMIQRLGEEHISYFECVFPLAILSQKQLDDPDTVNSNLRVFKEYITINEKRFDTLEEIAAKCLLLR
jgi:hypothetical protein